MISEQGAAVCQVEQSVDHRNITDRKHGGGRRENPTGNSPAVMLAWDMTHTHVAGGWPGPPLAACDARQSRTPQASRA